MNSPLVRLAGGLAVVLLASVRCQVALDPQPLQRFETCEDLEVFLQDQILHPGVEESFETGGAVVGCSAAASEPLAPGDDAFEGREGEGEGGGRDFTTTNTQEADVDEPDFVKNNGDHIFVLRRGEMIIARAWPADETAVLSRTTVGGTPFTMLFSDDETALNVDRALVISTFNTTGPHVLAKLFDVSDVTAPVELRSIMVEGTFVDARAVDDEVMLVTHSQLLVDRSILSTDPFSDDENRARLQQVGIDRMLPQISDFIVGEDVAPRVNKAIACENTYAPSRTDGRNILLVHGLSLRDETRALKSTGVVTQFSSVYASLSSIYLASTEASDGGYFTPSFATTRIHKLDAFAGDGAAEYQATGVITGRIKDELSIDEGPDGTLRVVITDDSESQDLSAQTTSLVVLQQDGTDLNEVSRVSDIGRGENVESVRFIGDFAYVVTYPADSFFFIGPSGIPVGIPFTDPLFVIDLSDPKAPRLRGELEVDGYSAYIHPLDEDHLLTVGVNTDPDDGTFEDLSVIVFNVADPDAPFVVDRLDFGGSQASSEALVERHAFTYFASQKALAIPVQQFNNESFLTSSALKVFRIDVEADSDEGETVIADLGDDLADGVEQAPLYQDVEGGNLVDVFSGPCAAVRRSVMISDRGEAFVYAISGAGMTVASIEPGLPTVANLRFGTIEDAVCDFSGSPL